MKKLLSILVLLFLSIEASAQIYYNGEKLNYSKIQGNRVGNVVGAYFTIGISSAKSYKLIEGDTSGTDITDKRPEFKFTFASKKDSLFADKNNFDGFVLVQLIVKKKMRRLITGKYGISGVQVKISEDIIQPFSVDEDETDENTFIVRPKKELEPGEYAFFYMKDKPEVNKVYDFTIK